MKLIFIFLFFISNLSFTKLSLEDLDSLKSFSNSNSLSLIESGTKFCNNFFNPIKIKSENYKNSFFCKFSKSRNRFYIYMLAHHKDTNSSIKNFCINFIKEQEFIFDHLSEILVNQNREFYKGFYIDNLFNNSTLDFSNNINQDRVTMNNEINRLIENKRNIFSKNNKKNNFILQQEISELKRIYNKIINNQISDLDKITSIELNKITRYKVFINDIKNYKSYSCTWTPGKGIVPYIKKEKFSEFENI